MKIYLTIFLKFLLLKFWIGKFFRQFWENLEEIRIGTGAKFQPQIGSKKNTCSNWIYAFLMIQLIGNSSHHGQKMVHIKWVIITSEDIFNHIQYIKITFNPSNFDLLIFSRNNFYCPQNSASNWI